MKTRVSIVAAILCGVLHAQTTPSAFEQIKKLGRGVNIIGYDPIWDDFAKARFQEKHFKLIKEGGFQTVRIDLQAFAHMDAENRLAPEWLKTLDWAVKNALTNDLMVILDLHEFVDCAKNAAACEAKVMAFWKQIAPRFKDAPPSVVFEILNEPNGQVTAKVWNEWIKEALGIIRETNPTRTVVIGPAFWNGIPALRSLELPPDDRNIIVTVHYYSPMQFTHQGAPWSPATRKLSGVTWGSDAEKAAVEKDFAVAQQWSKADHRPILLGEFGAYEKGAMEDRARYTAFIARTAESLGWAWTYWQFDSDFIVYDIGKDEWVKPIWKALVP